MWQRVVQRVAMNDNEWQRMTTRGTTSGTTSDNEWYNEWQRVTITTVSGYFGRFSFFREEITNRHPKESPLGIPSREPTALRADLAKQTH